VKGAHVNYIFYQEIFSYIINIETQMEPSSTYLRICPNIDIDTFNAVQNAGIQPTVHNRMILYYGLCIPLRLSLVYASYKYKDHPHLPMVVLALSVFTVYRLTKNLNGPEWWSRPFHVFVAVLLSLVSFLIIQKKIDSAYISYILLVDVLYGFTHSLFITRC